MARVQPRARFEKTAVGSEFIYKKMSKQLPAFDFDDIANDSSDDELIDEVELED